MTANYTDDGVMLF